MWGSGVRSRGPRVGSAASSRQSNFPYRSGGVRRPAPRPISKIFVSRRCINIQMPLRITHCRALAVKVHRRFYSPATAPARSRVPCEGSPARRAASPRGRRGEPTQQSHSHFAAGSSPVDAQVIELTMAKTFAASVARGLGALLLITLALETQANRARPASPGSFRGSRTPRRPGAPGEGLGLLHLRRRRLRLLRGLRHRRERRGQLLRDVRRLESSHGQAGRGHRVDLRVLWGITHGLERRQNY